MEKTGRTTDSKLLFFTLPITFLTMTCSLIGLFVPDFYWRETADWQVQCLGQDLSNLLVVVPGLLVSACLAARGSRSGKLIWIGLMAANCYDYAIYCFAVHFNPLFHLYCAIFGLSIYATIYFLIENQDNKHRFVCRVPEKTIGIFLIIVASLFSVLWLLQSLPAALADQVPAAVRNSGLPTNPVYVLDLSFFLPLMFISAVLLMKRHPLGYLLAPMMLIFAIVITINIVALSVVDMHVTGSNQWPLIIGFGLMTMICAGFVRPLLRNRPEKA